MPNQDRPTTTFELPPCDLGEFVARRRNLPIEIVNQQLGDWLVAYESPCAGRGRPLLELYAP